jgi:hypothetical protein
MPPRRSERRHRPRRAGHQAPDRRRNASESRVIIAAEHTMALLLALTRNIPQTPGRWLPETLRTERSPNGAALVMFRSEPVTEHPSARFAGSPQLLRRSSECVAPPRFNGAASVGRC